MTFVIQYVTADAFAVRWVEFVKNVTVVNMRLKLFHQDLLTNVRALSIAKMGQKEMYGTLVCLRQERDAE